MNSLVCIDASLVVRALIPAPLTDRALEQLARWERAGTELIAPSLLAFEVTSTLRRMVFLRRISSTVGEDAFAQFLRMNIRLSSRRGIFAGAWRLAGEFNRSRAYDAAYLALAQILACEFWTADERLYNAVSEKLKWVNWLGSVSAEAKMP